MIFLFLSSLTSFPEKSSDKIRSPPLKKRGESVFKPYLQIPLAVAHPGIQVGVGQVDQEIDEHHGSCDKQVNARDNGVVSL